MKLKKTRVFISLIILMMLLMGCKAFPRIGFLKDGVEKEDRNEENDENDKENIEDNDSNDESNENGPSAEESKALALNFLLSDGRGNTVNVSDYKDKFVFLNFFTTWCGYCMDEMPEFQKVYNEYKDDVEIIIVNVNFNDDISPSEVVAWYEEEGYTFPMLIDEDGSETRDFYPYVTGYPTTFIYDKGGKYLGYIPGALDEATMLKIIKDNIDE